MSAERKLSTSREKPLTRFQAFLQLFASCCKVQSLPEKTANQREWRVRCHRGQREMSTVLEVTEEIDEEEDDDDIGELPNLDLELSSFIDEYFPNGMTDDSLSAVENWLRNKGVEDVAELDDVSKVKIHKILTFRSGKEATNSESVARRRALIRACTQKGRGPRGKTARLSCGVELSHSKRPSQPSRSSDTNDGEEKDDGRISQTVHTSVAEEEEDLFSNKQLQTSETLKEDEDDEGDDEVIEEEKKEDIRPCTEAEKQTKYSPEIIADNNESDERLGVEDLRSEAAITSKQESDGENRPRCEETDIDAVLEQHIDETSPGKRTSEDEEKLYIFSRRNEATDQNSLCEQSPLPNDENDEETSEL